MSALESKPVIGHKETVLIVDGAHANLLILQNFMGHYSCNTLLASDCCKALQLFSQNNVSLILMDVMMPGMEGFDMVHNIRRIERELEKPQTPLIAVSGHIQPSEQHLCIQAGVNDYISKPIKAQDLIDMIKVWCPEMRFRAPNQAFTRAVA